MEFLLLQGANVHLRDRSHHTPMFDAASGGHTKVVTLLLNAGAIFSEEERGDVIAEVIRYYKISLNNEFFSFL